MAEASWVMARAYRLSRTSIVGGLRQTTASAAIAVSNRQAVDAALDAYESGGPGLSDHLIGHLNRVAGCATTLTFDKAGGEGNVLTPMP
jgi:predicted nucleic-acid-binding protein